MRSTGRPSSASKSMGRSSRAKMPKMRPHRESLPCGMAMPSPTPVEPSRSRCRIEFEDFARGQAGDFRPPIAHLLQSLLLAVDAQRREDRIGRQEVA